MTDENEPVSELEAAARAEQIKVLRTLATRIEHGEPYLPTDVFQEVLEDLELRVDEAAIAQAWSTEPDPPAIASSKPPGGKPPLHAPHEMRIFQVAQRAIDALAPPERDIVNHHLADLVHDALPRGVAAMPCARHGTHLKIRAGHHRILYRMRSGALLVVAVTTT